MSEAPTTARKRLDSWKEIAEYLGRDVRTAMRWEEVGFPVHRVPGGLRSGVFAIPEEIDVWLATRDQDLLDVTPESAEPAPHRNLPRGLLALVPVLVLTVALVLFLRHFASQDAHDLTFNLPNQSFHFTPASTIVLPGNHGNIAVGDLDHDGWPDLVIGSVPVSRFSVMLNHHGKFNQPVFVAGCPSSVGPAIGDFDDDGNLDVVFACYTTHQAQVWWGDGKGGFSSNVVLPAGAEPIRTASGDFNRDGISDFVIDASGGGPLTVYLGHRDRTFTRTDYQAGSNPHVPFVSDFNADGILDIAVACYAAGCHNLSLLRGVGDGTFAPAENLPVVSAAYSVFIADLTGDGIPDIFSGSMNGEESIFSGIGNGKFLPAKLAIKVGDSDMSTVFHHHGRNYIVDLQIYPAQLRLLSFDSQGNTTASNAIPLSGNPRYVISADFDNDGRDDLAALFTKGNGTYVTIYLQR
jgi:hypothetical protein